MLSVYLYILTVPKQCLHLVVLVCMAGDPGVYGPAETLKTYMSVCAGGGVAGLHPRRSRLAGSWWSVRSNTEGADDGRGVGADDGGTTVGADDGRGVGTRGTSDRGSWGVHGTMARVDRSSGSWGGGGLRAPAK